MFSIHQYFLVHSTTHQNKCHVKQYASYDPIYLAMTSAVKMNTYNNLIDDSMFHMQTLPILTGMNSATDIIVNIIVHKDECGGE